MHNERQPQTHEMKGLMRRQTPIMVKFVKNRVVFVSFQGS